MEYGCYCCGWNFLQLTPTFEDVSYIFDGKHIQNACRTVRRVLFFSQFTNKLTSRFQDIYFCAPSTPTPTTPSTSTPPTSIQRIRLGDFLVDFARQHGNSRNPAANAAATNANTATIAPVVLAVSDHTAHGIGYHGHVNIRINIVLLRRFRKHEGAVQTAATSQSSRTEQYRSRARFLRRNSRTFNWDSSCRTTP
jgi:hypothetical protein